MAIIFVGLWPLLSFRLQIKLDITDEKYDAMVWLRSTDKNSTVYLVGLFGPWEKFGFRNNTIPYSNGTVTVDPLKALEHDYIVIAPEKKGTKEDLLFFKTVTEFFSSLNLEISYYTEHMLIFKVKGEERNAIKARALEKLKIVNKTLSLEK